MLELRADRRRLERENLGLPHEVGYWQSRHRDALKRIAALEQEIERLEAEKRRLQAALLKTSRLVHVHPDTVSRYGRRAGEHSRAAHDEPVAESPATREVQMDEKWSFVAKKEKNCDQDNPADQLRGDCWDHVALDAKHWLVLTVIPGERTAETAGELVADVNERLGGRTPASITTDEYAPYPGAILEIFGEEVVSPRSGKPGRPRKPYEVAPEGLNYATVHKTGRRAVWCPWRRE